MEYSSFKETCIILYLIYMSYLNILFIMVLHEINQNQLIHIYYTIDYIINFKVLYLCELF
jgi:hypothetical protein